MAVAARPGPSDARVPCPLCGGLIHPIAGKCKHCKADLTTYHAVRPAANAPLPALHPAASGNGHANGHVTAPTAYAPTAHAVPMPVAAAHDVSQPVLPPRPTLRNQTAEPRASNWRSWPVLVIILATLAIVAAVALMVWPGDRRDPNDKHMLGPPPAPDRMQTAPEIQPPQVPNQQAPAAPPQNGATRDPWTGQIDPPQDLGGNPFGKNDKNDKDDTDIDDSQDLSLVDPFSAPRPLAPAPGRRHLQVNGRGMMWLAMLTHACRKMIQCGTSDPAVQSACEDVARTPSTPPANCAAATRCLRHIDTMSCGNQIDDLSQLSRLMMQFRDCADATQC